jgi:hypothetical protein
MPERSMKRKGIIFSEIAEKGDTDPTYRLGKKQTDERKDGRPGKRLRQAQESL